MLACNSISLVPVKERGRFKKQKAANFAAPIIKWNHLQVRCLQFFRDFEVKCLTLAITVQF